jgi:hypothetical protein
VVRYEAMWEDLRTPVIAALLALACAAVAHAGETRVLVLDVGETTGGTRVEALAEQLGASAGWAALGPDYVEPFAQATTLSSVATLDEIQPLLDRAEAQYRAFDTAGALATLEQASAGAQALADGEHGPLLLRFHWLFAQLALVEGQTAVCDAQLRQIVRVQPWWEAPVGYLTPEAAESLARERDQVLAEAVTLQVGHVPPDVTVSVDGLTVGGIASVPLTAGLHLVRVQREGFQTSRRWYAFEPGQTLAVTPPTAPSWDEDLRRRLREAMAAADASLCARLISPLARHARVDLVVLAVPGRGDSLDVGAVAPGAETWRLRPVEVRTDDAAHRIAGSRGATGTLGTLVVGLGGSMRVVPSGASWVAGAGGLGLELGGGIVLGGVFELRGIAGLSLHGPAGLETPASARGVDLVQRGLSLRGGALVGPRIPLGPGAHLWIGGGGGIAYCAMTYRGGEESAVDANGTGGFVQGAVAAGLSPADGVSFGPMVSLVHAAVPLSSAIEQGPPRLVSSSDGFTTLELGLRFSLTR